MANLQMTKRATQRAADNSDSVIHSSLDEGLISSPEQVGELISHIDPHDRVAIDTEADSLHCYREKLCLLQVSLPEGDFLVDPLAGNDLSAFADVWISDRRECSTLLSRRDYWVGANLATQRW
ncbi:MAG: hypothetical protein DME38_01540 [Verrucomicrobia bacterium]|nr:MAG: hypothetical protein DME38_01540 [Verrucomicrobiota bacterium]